eukprot:2117860-Amphidinium_carterae.1
MTLQAEGVQLLGEKAWTERASSVPHAALDLTPCSHDSAPTQVLDVAADLKAMQLHCDGDTVATATQKRGQSSHIALESDEKSAELLQPLQWRGADTAAMEPAAPLTAAQQAVQAAFEVTTRTGMQLALCGTSGVGHMNGCTMITPTELDNASQSLWQAIAQEADGLDRVKPLHGAGI